MNVCKTDVSYQLKKSNNLFQNIFKSIYKILTSGSLEGSGFLVGSGSLAGSHEFTIQNNDLENKIVIA
jgi:hypothetical protein